MIRLLAIGCLLVMLGAALYFPSAYPAQHFLQVLRDEHRATADLLGSTTADRLLLRSMSWQAREVSPASPPNDGTTHNAAQLAASREMAAMNRRLFGNAYFRSVEALAALAAFRLSTVLSWIPYFSALGIAGILDARIASALRTKEFGRHGPERFALLVGTGLILLAVLAASLLLPVPLPTSLAPLALTGTLVTAARSLAHLRSSN